MFLSRQINSIPGRTELTSDAMEYQELDSLISELQAMIEETSPQKGYWKQLWNLVGEIGTAFKGARYPSRGDKDEAWKQFKSLVVRAEARSAEAKERIREREREFEQRKNRSEWARRTIETKAAGARPLSGLERGIADIFLLPLTLAERLLEAVLGVKAKSELEQIHDELRMCSQRLKDAWGVFRILKMRCSLVTRLRCIRRSLRLKSD